MKKKLSYLVLLSLIFTLSGFSQNTIRIFDNVLFFDGYNNTSILPQPGPPGVLRLSTSLFTTKLSDDQLSIIGSELSMKVTVKAACDNYDRIGNVFLAFTNKGDTTYDPTTTKRMEIARFITPFMDKNKMPDTVSYSYEINNIASLLSDKKFTDSTDIWVELSVFGVPYAANTQIAGCSGRNDVFYGTVDFITNEPSSNEDNFLNILANYKSLNNYTASATDTIGKTMQTISFTTNTSTYDTKIFLITSNHGANTGGEEYNRRDHFVYFDGTQVLQYKPGFTSCEPYRKYNTQANGIYGASPMSNASWQSFSNWCPGAIIPIRTIDIGVMEAGTHTFKISVPTAQFVGQQGDIPLTVYIQGKKPASPISINEIQKLSKSTILFPNPARHYLTVESKYPIKKVSMYTMLGQEVYNSNSNKIDVSNFPNGLYSVIVTFENGLYIVKRFARN
jgi:hypothetical protein